MLCWGKMSQKKKGWAPGKQKGVNEESPTRKSSFVCFDIYQSIVIANFIFESGSSYITLDNLELTP